jgi:hypothetical protein
MMTLLFMVEREWSLIDPRSFSVGYISALRSGGGTHSDRAVSRRRLGHAIQF